MTRRLQILGLLDSLKSPRYEEIAAGSSSGPTVWKPSRCCVAQAGIAAPTAPRSVI